MDNALQRHFLEAGMHLHWQDTRPWQNLKMLESRELCAELMERRHGRSPNIEHSLELATAIAQGRQYFESAKTASHLTRPLLLYYGILSLSRSVVLASHSNARESTLLQRHGLKAGQWKEELNTSQVTILDLEAEVTHGTFSELAEATENRERGYAIYEGRYLEPIEDEGTVNLFEGFADRKISLSSLIARVPDLQEGYRSTFGNLGRAYPTIVYSYGEIQKDYFLIDPNGDLPSADELKRRFDWPPELEIKEEPHHHLLGKIPGLEFRISENTLTRTERDASYPVKNDRFGFPYLVEPLANGYQLSTLSLMYAISYFAGMLVRYFPSKWAALSSHSVRDKEHSLLIRALDTIEDRFPQLILDELDSSERLDGRYRGW